MAKKDTGIVNIHGKAYKTVALRVEEFRNEFTVKDGWGITTEVLHANDTTVLLKATIYDPDGRVVGTGHGEERRNSSNINKTSAIENAETSAIGRALASCGLAGSEFASADELVGALSQQKSLPKAATADRGTHTPSQKQKSFAWKLIQQLPEADQQEYLEVAGLATTVDKMSALIDELLALQQETR